MDYLPRLVDADQTQRIVERLTERSLHRPAASSSGSAASGTVRARTTSARSGRVEEFGLRLYCGYEDSRLGAR
jgi:hypothetical protein